MTRPTCSVPRWASIARRTGARRSGPAAPDGGRGGAGEGCGSDSGGLPLERRLQAGLGLVVEGGLDDLATVLRDPREHLVGGALADEHHDRRAAVLEVGAEPLHELVVDA